MPSLRERRRAAGLTLRYVAGISGMHHSDVSVIERGLRPCSVESLYRLARVVGDVQLVDVLEAALPALFTQVVSVDDPCRHVLANIRFMDVPHLGGAMVCQCGKVIRSMAWTRH